MFEKWLRETFFGGYEPPGYTQKWDIPATANPDHGRIPVNPSGGLGAFGEAVPAQAIAQVCEMTWQLRGEAGKRQVEGAKVALSINQGLFGHGSSVIVKR